jgi:hypothetical protein
MKILLSRNAEMSKLMKFSLLAPLGHGTQISGGQTKQVFGIKILSFCGNIQNIEKSIISI